ncbi:MAG: hypothetical protein GC204_20695 [Chloroflexi bacterium]|nr:hypothetical protein [Chloroflexota bacterium]
MRRWLLTIFLLLSAVGAQAQSKGPQAGDPPVLARIAISAPTSDGTVTITGSNGSVFSNAYISLRNLYTNATVYTQAGETGSFTAQIAGSPSTPFWISPSTAKLPPEAKNTPGSLQGGPGAILYNPLASATALTPPTTKLVIDGNLTDWDAYLTAKQFDPGTRAVYALRNNESFYVALSGTYVTTVYAKLEVRFTIDTSTYSVTLDPRQPQPADLQRVNPVARDLGELAVNSRQSSVIELRIPLSFLNRADHLNLDSVRWLDANGDEISSDSINREIPKFNEIDGIAHARSVQGGTPFNIAGSLGSTGAEWSASGQADALKLTPGASWNVQMDVDYGSIDLPLDAQMIGQIALQPIARSVDGDVRVVGGLLTNNGWSSVLTPSGMAIDNLRSSIILGEAGATSFQLVRGASDIRFPLDFTLTIPTDLPAGLYAPTFTGFIQLAGSGERTRWSDTSAPPARLPLIVNVGGVENVRLLWTLFADDPSDGSRGILPDEDQSYAMLSNRVRFDSPTYILTPFKPGTRDPNPYPLEPYLLDQLPNSYVNDSAPLIPFKFPGGQLEATVTQPNGTVDSLGTVDIAQNQLSTAAADERTLFGAQSPVDEYRLTTLNPKFSAYSFTQYGEYTIQLSGDLQDLWGNHYVGGGTYKVLAAELLDLTPGVLPGTPFEVGDVLNFGLHISPGFPADVKVDLRIYPLDGSAMLEHTVTGKANARGYFQPTDIPLSFDTPGEYVIDYEVRYTGKDQRLWAASLRSAGAIAGAQSNIVAHGERGIPNTVTQQRPAWFSLPAYLQAAGLGNQSALFFPYHSGDVAWVSDGSASSITPVIRAQDLALEGTDDGYARWLIGALPNTVAANGESLSQLANEGELPVTLIGQGSGAALNPTRLNSNSYTYISAVRPNVTVRQFVSGGDDGGLTLNWDQDDPLNRQIGAGLNGNAAGDYIFLFGGAVIREGNLRDSAIYGALAVVTHDDPLRIYPPDRGASGGADGGALLTIKGQPVDTFIDMTGVQPGEVLSLGDTLAVAGQVAPPLAASVNTTLTSPSGRVFQFSSKANAVGYYYDPAVHMTVDELGIWTVDVQVVQDGISSSGQSQAPFPEGSVLGANNQRFSVYVQPKDATPLEWNPLLTDTIIPIVSPYNFSFTLPTDWTRIQAYYTLTTPGYIIDDSPIHMNGRSFSYQYNAPLQNRASPNLENDGRSGTYVADTRTLTFVATGVDANGVFQIRSRTFTLMHDRLITTDTTDTTE